MKIELQHERLPRKFPQGIHLGSLQSRRNFGERVLGNFITKIMAAFFNFNGSGELGREINLY